MSDDYDGWALLLVTALSQPIPLQTPEPPTAKACTPRRAFYTRVRITCPLLTALGGCGRVGQPRLGVRCKLEPEQSFDSGTLVAGRMRRVVELHRSSLDYLRWAAPPSTPLAAREGWWDCSPAREDCRVQPHPS
jgi:hypothetical protein